MEPKHLESRKNKKILAVGRLEEQKNFSALIRLLSSKDFHIDGYISESNRKDYIPGAASLIVSKIGSGRVIVFADNPNFRGSWYGTNKLFLNALFLGSNISVPGE